MKILFIGGDIIQLRIMNHMNGNLYQIEAIGYDNVTLPSFVTKRKIEDIKLNNYKVIFLPQLGISQDNSINSIYSLNKIYITDFWHAISEDAIVFSGYNEIKSNNQRSDEILDNNDNNIINRLINDVKNTLNYDFNETYFFVYGYSDIGIKVVKRLIELGANVRVGTPSKAEFKIIMANGLNGIRSDTFNLMKLLIDDDEIIINTINDFDINQKDLDVIDRKNRFFNINEYYKSPTFMKTR